MISINVKSTVKEVRKHLNRVQKKQIPFATARALTWTAQDMQKFIQEKITSIFKTTKKWWLKQQPTGIKIRPAKKYRLISTVYTGAYFAKLQEEGGTKRPRRSKKLLIPDRPGPEVQAQGRRRRGFTKSTKCFFDRARNLSQKRREKAPQPKA